MKYVFIINPNAGKRKSSALIKEIEKTFKDPIIILTKGKGDATSIARRIASDEEECVVFACGGDGTIHEVANGLVGSKTKLGIIPYGTGNDFIKAFEDVYTREDFLQLKNYVDGIVQPCDVLKVQDKYAINTASAGLDVYVADNVDKFKKIPFVPSTVPYFMGLLISFFTHLYHIYTLYIDGKEKEKQTYSFVVACNGRYYGGGFKPCPSAETNDGIIDICLVQNVSRMKILTLAKEYEKGTHVKEEYKKYIEMKQARSLQIRQDAPILMCLDGEIYEMQDPTIEVVEKAITLYLPKK